MTLGVHSSYAVMYHKLFSFKLRESMRGRGRRLKWGLKMCWPTIAVCWKGTLLARMEDQRKAGRSISDHLYSYWKKTFLKVRLCELAVLLFNF